MRSRPSWPGFVATVDSHPRQMRALAAYRFDAKRMGTVRMPTLARHRQRHRFAATEASDREFAGLLAESDLGGARGSATQCNGQRSPEVGRGDHELSAVTAGTRYLASAPVSGTPRSVVDEDVNTRDARSNFARERGALLGGQPGLALAAVGPRPRHPLPQRRGGQIQVPGDLHHRLALVEHQPHRSGPEVIREAPPRPPMLLLVCHGRHRIYLSFGVHRSGSTPSELAPIPWTPGLCRQLSAAPVGFGFVRAPVLVA